MSRRWLLGLTTLLLCFALACTDEETTIRVGNHEITVEIAADNASRRHGLMERQSMPPDHGMLFIFPHEKTLSFWMKNTPLPLSIAYADSEGRIVRIADLEPLSLDAVPSVRPALYALEMNRGWFQKNGVIEGDRVRKIPEVDVR
jgi:uncharacterized membrane protein (UPF0127 family)